MKRTIDLPVLYIIAYAAFNVLLTAAITYSDTVLGYGEAEDFLLVLVIPLFYSIFYHTRLTFYFLLLMAYMSSFIVLHYADQRFFLSSLNTVTIYGAIIALCGEVVFYSLKKLRETEREILEREKNYRGIFNGIHEAVFVHDSRTGKILDVNDSTCELYGYRKEEFEKLTVEDLSSGEEPYTQEKAVELVQKALGYEVTYFEWHSRKKSGDLFWTEVNLKRVDIGENTFIVATARDITPRKAIEQERDNVIQDLQNALIEIDKLKEIIPICSHCKKVRNDEGYWEQVEKFVHVHYKTSFSHSICPECEAKHYADYLD